MPYAETKRSHPELAANIAEIVLVKGAVRVFEREPGRVRGNVLSEKVRPDKRRYLRYEILDYAVVQLDAERRTVNTVIADISLGGLQLRSKEPFQPGSMCTIRVGFGDGEPIGLRAEVRHSISVDNSDLYITGMRFIPEAHSDRMAIAEYVHAIFQRQCDNLLV